jgi:hypothetical protein
LTPKAGGAGDHISKTLWIEVSLNPLGECIAVTVDHTPVQATAQIDRLEVYWEQLIEAGPAFITGLLRMRRKAPAILWRR